MKMSLYVDVTDFDLGCSAMISRVSRGTRVATTEAANAILNAAQNYCPKFTGTLMRSGRFTIEGDSKDNYKKGFSAEIYFGGGNDVNPLTGEHPRQYAAAVHEGFAVNPITGEYSKYRTGTERFLEKAVLEFDKTGLPKIAYKHWGAALGYFNQTQNVKAANYLREARGYSPLGYEKVEVESKLETSRGSNVRTRTEVTDVLTRKDFFSDSTRAIQNRAKTRVLMGVTDKTIGVTNENLYIHFLENKRLITKANLYNLGYGVDAAADEVVELANMFKEAGVYSLKGKGSLTKKEIAEKSHASSAKWHKFIREDMNF